MKRKIVKFLGNLLLISMILLVCIPVFYVVAGSVKSGRELTTSLFPIIADESGAIYEDTIHWSLLPNYPTLMNFVKLLLFTPQFYIVFWNSMKITVLILLGQLLVSVPAAWAFARFEFRFRKLLFTIYIILMLMPFQVTMLSSYLVLNQAELLDTHWSVILPAVFSTFPVFLTYRGFRSIPKALIEAAKMDGAGELMIFLRIGIPIGSSGILSSLVLGFLDCWNLVEQPLAFLRDKSLWPLSLYLPEISLEKAGLAFAASVVTLLPAVFVFIIGQDYLEQGIVAAAIKE